MSRAGSAFRRQNVIVTIVLHHLRSFGLDLPVTAPNQPGFPHRGTAVGAQLHHTHTAVEQHIMAAILIVEKRGVNAVLMNPRRFLIGSFGVGRACHHLAAGFRVIFIAAVRRRDEIPARVGIIGEIRCPVSAASL